MLLVSITDVTPAKQNFERKINTASLKKKKVMSHKKKKCKKNKNEKSGRSLLPQSEH